MSQLISFITIFRAVTGLKLQTMATAGNPTWPQAILTGALMPTVTGLTLRWDGHGCLMKISAGPPTTTAAGPTWAIMAGCGSQAMTLNGDPPGCRGEPGAIMWAGPRCLRAALELSMKDSPLADAWTSNTISARPITILSTFVLSVSRSCAIAFSRPRKTSPISTTP